MGRALALFVAANQWAGAAQFYGAALAAYQWQSVIGAVLAPRPTLHPVGRKPTQRGPAMLRGSGEGRTLVVRKT
jgi:hypothetical protein